MDKIQIVEALNAEIASLTAARDSLMNGTAPVVRRGRKPGSKNGFNIVAPASTAAPVPKRRSNMSPEGRKRLADAMRARWAARKKSGAAKPAKKAAKTAVK